MTLSREDHLIFYRAINVNCDYNKIYFYNIFITMSSSSEEDIMIALACHEIENHSSQRFWVHDINLKRGKLGEFHHLFSDLTNKNFLNTLGCQVINFLSY